MRVYKLTPSNCFALLDLKGDGGSGGIILFPETSLVDDWVPLEVEVYAKLDDDPSPSHWIPQPGNYTTVMGAPAVDQNALDSINDLISEDCEILPVILNNDKYFVLHVRRLLPVEEDLSILSYYRDGDVMWIERPVFMSEHLDNVSIFKATARNPDGSVYYSGDQAPYVTERFIRRVIEQDLTGFNFEPI